MKPARRRRTSVFLAVMATVTLGCAAFAVYVAKARPAVEPYARMATVQAEPGTSLRVTFLGVSTLLLRTDQAAILVDGFFTRPGLLRTAALRLEPDLQRIAGALDKAAITQLDAVIAAHSHYDHAMDSPEVAKRTGAIVVGSESTANIARGHGLPEERIRIVRAAETLAFGDLSVTLIPSQHFPHGVAMGEITEPLVTPARASAYQEGGSFSILVEHRGRGVLVQASAGYVERALAGRRADVVYLGVGLLGQKDGSYREAYWQETAGAVGARRVIPIHWDDFMRGLDEPLAALPYLFDDLETSMEFILARAGSDKVDVRWPVLWQETDPFAGL